MQVDDIVELLVTNSLHRCSIVVVEVMEFVNVRIANGNCFELFFGKKMNLCPRHLLFNATDGRSGEHNIANRRKADDEKL